MSIVVGRPELGICLNPLEYILNEDDTMMEFNTIDEAKQFLIDHGEEPGDRLEDCYMYQDTKDLEYKEEG